MKQTELIKIAREAMEKAYAPYSQFAVGAALEGRSGKIYSGCNIENVSYGAGVCAERVAIFKGISSGEKEFKRILLTSSSPSELMPCGICRQVLWELAGDLEIIIVKGESTQTYRLSDLFPKPFSFSKPKL